jgi:hypothetical protein
MSQRLQLGYVQRRWKGINMEPRYYDAAGNIDFDSIRAHSIELRQKAVDAFWSDLFARLAIVFAKMQRSSRPLKASAAAHW